jgi:2,4-dienoyl-CoA reductase-like NADH-dependent reductase (Old Yellow Enzyme family)/NADH dehydrogenase FAD-containing subunit
MRDPIFDPIVINQLNIKNRIYMPAMHLGMAVDYEVSDPLVEFYAERARGGAGLICVGYATVDELSGNTTNIGAHQDAFVPGLTRLAKAINENGACSAVQLNHAGRYNFSFFLNGQQPVAPSAIASRMTKETPHALTRDEIHQIIDNFARAAGRVQAAGFDAVEILSGTGYLISEFLSPLTNQREDDYGGDLNNRMRFGLEVMQAIRRTVGADYPVIVRMNGNDFMVDGQDRQELQVYAKALQEQGRVDALSINVGWHEARVPQITTAVPRGAFAYLARAIKTQVTIPVIYGHRVNDPGTARELILDDMCDMIAMGRSLIADPYLPEKTRQNHEKQIAHCVACAQGCFDNLFKLKSVECLCNPKAGHEGECPETARTETPKTIMVVGGGAAGMRAALTASERGHVVHLYEASRQLGGQLYLAAAPPGRAEFAELARDLAVQVSLSPINVHLNTVVDEALIQSNPPDHIIIATGARPVTPPIPGIDGANVVQAWDVLRDRVHTGKKVVIIGGGAVGVEVALFLAEKGTLSGETLKFLMVNKAEPMDELYNLAINGTKEVVLIEMIDRIGEGLGKTTRWTLLQDLKRTNVQAMTATKALGITPRGVTVEDAQGNTLEIPADTVVLGVGSRSHNPLSEPLARLGITYTAVGDADQVATAFEAMHSGFKAGMAI